MPRMSKKYAANPDEFRRIRNKQRKENYKKTQKNGISRIWTKEEDKAVLAHDIPDAELSRKIMRSVQAIQSRRWRLKSNQV